MGYIETPQKNHVYLSSLRLIDVWRDVKFDEDKEMQLSLERELHIPQEEEILAPKEEPQEVVE